MKIQYTAFRRARLLISLPAVALLLYGFSRYKRHIGLVNEDALEYTLLLLLVTGCLFLVVSALIWLHHQKENITMHADGFTVHGHSSVNIRWKEVAGYQLVLPPRRGAQQLPRIFLHLQDGRTFKFGYYPFFLSGRKLRQKEAASYQVLLDAVHDKVKPPAA
ncbi:hypothetical protein MKQ68_14095 [Chitinophaga horti]|uniref:PH domain-containing protein n=1 Tax=Chitinophaga horti TaxID=2920382 RepID=A0ABY6IV29_9BACT|nr:hypothetical protein [Chitinophaga horti]UYQ91223.1 hypothetical protein MKQ68_14095 [Chitinophaga horti]